MLGTVPRDLRSALDNTVQLGEQPHSPDIAWHTCVVQCAHCFCVLFFIFVFPFVRFEDVALFVDERLNLLLS